jgi:hypothetical protein
VAQLFNVQPERDNPILGIVRNVKSKDVDPNAWLSLLNFGIRDGLLQKTGGWTQLPNNVDGVASFIQPLPFPDGSIRTIIGTTKGLFDLGGDNELTQITDFVPTIAAAERWRADYLLSHWWFTNKADGLLKLASAGGATREDSGGYKGRDILQFENHLVLANLASVETDGPQSFVGSGLANADTEEVAWDVTDINSDAVLKRIPDNGDVIQAIRRKVGQMAVYKESNIDLVTYLGGGDVYGRGPIIDTVGVQSAFSVIPVGDQIGDQDAFVGQTNLHLYDGNVARPFGDRIWTYWNGLIDHLAIQNVYTVRNRVAKEIYFIFKGTGAAGYTQALVWNWQYDSFALRDLPFQALGFRLKAGASAGLTFDQVPGVMDDANFLFETASSLQDFELVGADANGNLFVLDDATVQANGADIVAVAESGDTCHGSLSFVKLVNGMYIDAIADSGDNPLALWVCGRMSLDEPIVWEGPYTYDGGGRLDFFASGIWLRYKFVKTGGSLQMGGYYPSVRITSQR